MIWWVLLVLSIGGMVVLMPFAVLAYGEVKEGTTEPLDHKPAQLELPTARLTHREYKRLVKESARRRAMKYGMGIR